MDIFSKMKSEGNFNISIALASITLSLLNFLTSFAGCYFQNKVGQKKTLVYGMLIMLFSHVSIVGFYIYEQSIGIIIMICIFIAAFQASLGPIVYQHAQETCLDS